MSEQQLRDLLIDLADTVEAPTARLAPVAWTRAHAVRRRRRRVVAVCGAVCLTVVGSLVGVGIRDEGTAAETVRSAPSTAAEASADEGPSVPAAAPRFQQAPDPTAVGELPVTGAWFAALSSPAPARPPALSEDPARRIVAAVQVGRASPFLLGDDSRWRAVTLPQATLTSVDGGEGQVLSSSAISPDSAMLAFPQQDAVLIVDARTGTSKRYEVPGLHYEVAWLLDGRVVVDSGTALSLLDPGTGRVQRVDTPHQRLATGDMDFPLAEFTATGLVIRDTDGRVTARRDLSADLFDCDCDLYGPSSSRAGRIARNGFLSRTYNDDAAVLVADLASGRISDVLRLSDRGYDCCEFVGWLHDNTVLLRDGEHVLAWNFSEQTLQRIADLPGPDVPGQEVAVALSPVLETLGTS